MNKYKPHHSSYHNDREDSSYSYSYNPPSKTLTSKDHDGLDALLEDNVCKFYLPGDLDNQVSELYLGRI